MFFMGGPPHAGSLLRIVRQRVELIGKTPETFVGSSFEEWERMARG
jgi:hypothetical protein